MCDTYRLSDAQIALAARRYVDAMATVRIPLDGGKGRIAECDVPESMCSIEVREDTVSKAIASLTDYLIHRVTDWPACEVRRAETGRGTPLFDPPKEGE